MDLREHGDYRCCCCYLVYIDIGASLRLAAVGRNAGKQEAAAVAVGDTAHVLRLLAYRRTHDEVCLFCAYCTACSALALQWKTDAA